MTTRRRFLAASTALIGTGVLTLIARPFRLGEGDRMLPLSEVLDPTYRDIDVSAGTDLRLSFLRAVAAEGALVHTTGGLHSLGYLQGGVLREGRIAGATYLIDRDGTRRLLTPAHRVAYHAGQSELLYRDKLYHGDLVSQLLIGYELECSDNQYPTYEQHDSLAERIVLDGIAWGWRFPYAVFGHYSVARPVGRRSDPVNFQWGDFFGRLLHHAQKRHIDGLG